MGVLCNQDEGLSMNKHKRLAAALMLATASAFAQQMATTVKDVHLRAGPSRDLPVDQVEGEADQPVLGLDVTRLGAPVRRRTPAARP